MQPNDIQVHLSPEESNWVAWALQVIDNMSDTKRSSLGINDIAFRFRSLLDRRGVLTIPNHPRFLEELEYRLTIQCVGKHGAESAWKKIKEAVKESE
jgi:hypothetical protein